MKAIDVTQKGDRYLISIEKSKVDKNFINRLIERLQLEFLANETDFEDSITKLDEEIKEDWWKKNKTRILKPNQ